MLKLFRKYEKWIIGIGMTVLMVIFLIEPTLQVVGPNRDKEPVGRLADGTMLRVGSLREAEQVRLVAEQFMGPLALGGRGEDESLRVAMMLHEAKAMGLTSSAYEVDELLGTLGVDGPTLQRIASELRTQPAALRAGLRQWLTLQTYREVMLGLTHLSTPQRLQRFAEVGQARQLGGDYAAIMALASTQGDPRVSPPLLARMISDLLGSVTVSAFTVRASSMTAQVDAPDEARLTELFEAHRDQAPGEGPHGLGYRLPDRVRLEYLSVTDAQLRAAVSLEETQLIEFYDANPTLFTAAGAAEPQAYPMVRDRVREQLLTREAAKLGDRIIRDAHAELSAPIRRLPVEAGYVTLPSDGSARVSLEQVASLMQQRHGVLPTVVRRDDRWLSGQELLGLPGIGLAELPRGERLPPVPFTVLALSARELHPDAASPLSELGVQVGVPSQPLSSSVDASRYLFRLIAAEASHAPATLDEVRMQVDQDARSLAAYAQLQERMTQWLAEAQTQGLEALAESLGQRVVTAGPFPRRQSIMGRAAEAPYLPSLNLQSQAFVDAVFAKADRDPKTTEPAQRCLVVADDRTMTVVLARLESVEPIDSELVNAMAGNAIAMQNVRQLLMAEAAEAGEAGEMAQDSLDLEALKVRLGFTRAGEDGNG